jgi:tetratricopeptide (TPR) repeat protein
MPETADPLAAALACQVAGQVDDAIRLYRETLDASPEHPSALFNLGLLAACQEHYDEAAGYFHRMLTAVPEHPETLACLASLMAAQGHDTEAEAYYQRAIELKPELPAVHASLGNLYERMSRLIDAEECYAQALTRDERLLEVQIARGKVLNALGRRGEAVACFETVLSIDPDHGVARRELGLVPVNGAEESDQDLRALLPGFSVPQSMNRTVRRFIETRFSPYLSSVFFGDNLITLQKSVGFMSDPRFVSSVAANQPDADEAGRTWRIHTLIWAAKNALNLDGDFVELGVLRGFMSGCVIDYLDFGRLDRAFHLYDTFAGLPAHDPDDFGKDFFDHLQEVYESAGSYEAVCERFAPFDNVKVIRGAVPDSLHGTAPERICYLHLDLNSAKAEVGALNYLWERIVPGAYIVYDDYGWSAFPNQKRQHDRFMADKNLSILELPTGQGLVIKQ